MKSWDSSIKMLKLLSHRHKLANRCDGLSLDLWVLSIWAVAWKSSMNQPFRLRMQTGENHRYSHHCGDKAKVLFKQYGWNHDDYPIIAFRMRDRWRKSRGKIHRWKKNWIICSKTMNLSHHRSKMKLNQAAVAAVFSIGSFDSSI